MALTDPPLPPPPPPPPAEEPVADGLSPAQREILEALGARPHERPQFDPRLRDDLRGELEERLAPIVSALPQGQVLNVSKHALATVHGCEALFLANVEQPFEWSAATATGSVAHKAIELSVHWRGEPAPGVLVDEAIGRLIAGTDGIGDWLGGLGEGERADLRSGAVERTTMFLECFPALEARWRPVTESRLRADLCADRVILRGKVDLTVGRADGLRAGKVLLDLKTGGFAPSHREDLRFYALLETLRLGVPPRLLASYYLDQGRLQQEVVSENLLRSALERVVDGTSALVDLLHSGREPVLRPAAPCRWCQIRSGCETGQRWLTDKVDEEGW
jgi:hypothetical protein